MKGPWWMAEASAPTTAMTTAMELERLTEIESVAFVLFGEDARSQFQAIFEAAIST